MPERASTPLLIAAERAMLGASPPPEPTGTVTAPSKVILSGAVTGAAHTTPSSGFDIEVAGDPIGALSCTAATRKSAARVGVILTEASSVDATVVPPSYDAIAVSLRTTSAIAAGRSCQGSAYGGAGALGAVGAAALDDEVTVVG